MMKEVTNATLFGVRIDESKRGAILRNDYDAFVEKFKPKLTTDDCYTPPAVYDVVLNYAREKYNLGDRHVVRPFWPSGDYERFDYPTGCVVVDNPPFSIITKICRFYVAKQIDFFLFAPHLTLFSGKLKTCTYFPQCTDIVYDNGAKVKTSFISNMSPDIAIVGDPVLHQCLRSINAKNSELPKYIYPDNVLTASMVSAIVSRGVGFEVRREDVVAISALDSQRAKRKAIFGTGFLLSGKAAAEKAAAEKAAAGKAAIIEWKLSDRERLIVKR